MIDADRRRALENERKALQFRIAEWTVAADRGVKDDLLGPSMAGCGVAFLLAAAMMFITYQMRLTNPQMLVGGIVIAALVAVTFNTVRRRSRTMRMAEAKRAREMSIALLRGRLREIDKLLAEP